MKKFVLASFNICSAHFIEERYTEHNLAMVADKIVNSGADVVAMQEVDVGAARSNRVDMPTRLSEMTGLKYHYFIKIRDFEGGEYGTAVLSHYPIVESKTIHYPVKIATQGTSCGYVVLDVNGKEVTVFNTHLSVENDASNIETLCCLRDVLTEYQKTQKTLLACGDFNTYVPRVAEYLPNFNRVNETYPTYADRIIDHIIYTGDLTACNGRTIDTQFDRTTDHNMLLCDVTLK